ncbi:MAG: hypothetical protein HGB02_06715 [Chlorobiaceae bacterium]|nr:hypothetical protein [Chlorobiaceae bacterium]
MDLFDFIPFKDEMAKVYQGLMENATHTSETPVFSELRVRRYAVPIETIAEFTTRKVEHWVGWNLKNQKTAVGGMRSIRAEVSSFALLGMKIDITFGLLEETDVNGLKITTVNGKAHTRIDSKGDLGESRRMLRMMLSALDFEFKRQIVKDEDYSYRSLDPKGATGAFQQLFDDTKLEHRPSSPKAKTIEFKKTPRKEVDLHSAGGDGNEVPATRSANAPEPNGSVSATAAVDEAPKPAKPKITVISLKKNS